MRSENEASQSQAVADLVAETTGPSGDRGTTGAAKEELRDYLFSDDYLRLLHRAILSRLSTTSAHEAEHLKALGLFEKAFPGQFT